MPSFISHLYLAGGLGDTLPLGDVVETLRSGTVIGEIVDAAVADNGDAIVMWREVTPNTTPDQIAPWVARRVNGEWQAAERLVSPAAIGTNAYQYGRCVGIGSDGDFYAVVSGFEVTSSFRVYRYSGGSWATVSGNISRSAVPFKLVTRAAGVMALFLRSGTGGISTARITGSQVMSSVVIGNAGAFASLTKVVAQGEAGEIAVVLPSLIASSTNDGASWTSTTGIIGSAQVWDAWMSQSGVLNVVYRTNNSTGLDRQFSFLTRTASGTWSSSFNYLASAAQSDIFGLRTAGDWIIHAQDEAVGNPVQNATYAHKFTGSGFESPIQMIKDDAPDGFFTSVDTVLRYADNAYVGEMFTPDGLTYITNEGGQWNPRTVPSGFETAGASILSLSPGRNYSIGLVMASADNPSTPADSESNLLVTLHRRT